MTLRFGKKIVMKIKLNQLNRQDLVPGPMRAFAPKHVAIMYRPNSEMALVKAKDLAQWLKKRDLNVYSSPGQSLGAGFRAVTPKSLDLIDWVIVLGGDGTYLGAVRMLEGRHVPILGVNMGNLGFLTETKLPDLIKNVTCALEGQLELRARSMLLVQVRRGKRLRSSHIALNDAVLERGSNTHLINIEVHSQKNLVSEIKADALIIASPTGSTAYNLAAGGPILHPDVKAIVVTPVCPHALTSRPLIFPDDQELSFRVVNHDKKAILTVDGVSCGEITVDDQVLIVRHSLEHFVIRKPTHNYFSLLREKLKFGVRD
jgi:NAD+ kinase